jgi:dolichyl-phosphate beta-glucosyltransferase
VFGPGTHVIVPCFNEAERLRPDGFAPLFEHDAVQVLFVDDGSTDDTPAILRAMAARRADKIRVLTLAPNAGKAEAVRRGMLDALGRGAEIVGFLDADLATPADEMLRLRGVLAASDADVVLGARVALLGRDIRRSAARHYLGRVFATAASAVLGLVVYDTQCGAKLFRRTPALERALAAPFVSRWIFDVELLGRLVPDAHAHRGIIEVPLETWHDVKGSKIRPRDMALAAFEMARVGIEVARWRRRLAGVTEPTGRPSRSP